MREITDKEILEKVEPFSETVTKILDVLNKPDVKVDEVEFFLEKDISLSARILTFSNAALYGAAGKVTTIRNAVNLMGFERLREIILAVKVIEYFSNCLDKKDMHGFWLHSYMTAEYARSMAKRCGLDPNISFYCGLFHDIGKLVLYLFFIDHYHAVRRYQLEEGCSFYTAEQQVYHSDHTRIGTIVARLWNFPEFYVYCIKNHHEKMRSREINEKYTQVVRIADSVVRAFQAGDGHDDFVPFLDFSAMDFVGLQIDDIVHGFEKLFTIKYDNTLFV